MNQKGLGERKNISYDSITCTGSMGIISAYLFLESDKHPLLEFEREDKK